METRQEKIKKLKRFTDQTLQRITESKDEYKQFLSFQARLYKHKFEDSLLIYAQNPNTIACATYEQWHDNRVGRKVHKGSKGIALFADDSGKKLKHVFDLSQTHGKAFTFPIQHSIPEQYQKALIAAFDTNTASNTFSKNFKLCIEDYVNKNYDKFIEDFARIKKDNKAVSNLSNEMFRKTIAESVGFIACEKFSINKGIYDSEKSFESLHDFNSKELTVLLGSTTQYIAKNTIQHINTVMETERKKEQEQKAPKTTQNQPEQQPAPTAQVEPPRQPSKALPLIPEIVAYNGDKSVDENLVKTEDKPTIIEANADTDILSLVRDVDEPIIIIHESKVPSLSKGDTFTITDADKLLAELENGNLQENENQFEAILYHIHKDSPDTLSQLSFDYKLGNGGIYNRLVEILNEDLDFLSNSKIRQSANFDNHIENTGNAIESLNPYIESGGIRGKSEKSTSAENKYEDYDFEYYRGIINPLARNIADYKEPFVVFHYSPNPDIAVDTVIHFWKADLMLQEAEKKFRQEYGTTNPYRETIATIFYMNDKDDLRLSTYNLTYDLGAYDESNSGLFNRVNYYYNYLENEYKNHPDMKSPFETKEDIENAKNMLVLLDGYRTQSVNSDEIHKTSEPSGKANSLEKEVASLIEDSVELMPSTYSPEPETQENENTLAHQNYRQFVKLFPEIADGTFDYANYYAAFSNPLIVHTLEDNRISMTQHHLNYLNKETQGLNMILDINHEEQTLNTYSNEHLSSGVFQIVGRNATQTAANHFTQQWFTDLKQADLNLSYAKRDKETLYQNFEILEKEARKTILADKLCFPEPILITSLNYSLANIDFNQYEYNETIGYAKNGDRVYASEGTYQVYELETLVTNGKLIEGAEIPQRLLEQMPFYIYEQNKLNNPIIRPYAEVDRYSFDDFNDYLESLKSNVEDYKEPIVVIERSENDNFIGGEILSFREANEKFQEIEKQFRNENGLGYEATEGHILYLDNESTQLSAYRFSYITSDNVQDKSGIINQITDVWNYKVGWPEIYNITEDDTDKMNRMLAILSAYTAEQMPQAEPQTENITTPPIQVVENSSPEPVFIESYNDFSENTDFDKYSDGDIIGYGKSGSVCIADKNNYDKYKFESALERDGSLKGEYSIPQEFLERMPNYIYNRDKLKNPITKPFAEVNPSDFDNSNKYIEHLTSKVSDYSKPIVLTSFSENNNFAYNEILPFSEANEKYKTIEKAFREERKRTGIGGYDKTDGVILYLNKPDDTELSFYKFNYDIGDYDEKNSGIINHITNFWKHAQNHPEIYKITEEDTDEVNRLLAILNAAANGLEQQADEPKKPSLEPVLFEDFAKWRKSINLDDYKDGDILGYDKDGVKYSLSIENGIKFINTEINLTPYGEIIGSYDIPVRNNAKTENFNNETTIEPEVTAEQPEPFFIADNQESKQQPKTSQLSLTDLTTEQEVINWTAPTTSPPLQTTNTDTKTESEDEGKNGQNYVITTADDIALVSGKTKYRYNIEAIQTLKNIEAENRSATAEEQTVLAKFSGFGGIPQAFDPNNENWKKEYEELQALLSESEYEKLSHSVLNAHYTSPEVINAMYQGLERLGFKGGNLLEPSCGDGRFFGMLPNDLQEKTKLYGVELDSLTGRLASQLYPDANIEIKGFQDTNYQDSFFDAAIGNVPFGSYPVADKRYDRHNFLIHDYFLAKTLDKVKPEGVIAFVTSSGTMDKANTKARQYIAERAELLGAIRLPNTAFKESANTDVTTDILFLKKRDCIIDATDEEWVYTGYYETGNTLENGEAETLPLNEYFINNPHMMLGKMKYDKSMYGNDKLTALHPFENQPDLKELLKKAISFLPENVVSNYASLDDLENLQEKKTSLPADPNVKNFCYAEIDGKIYQRENSEMILQDLDTAKFQRMKALISLRDEVKNLIDIQLLNCSDDELAQAQQDLNTHYDSFVKKYGNVNSRYNRSTFGEDSEYPLLSSIENINEDETVEKADIFSKRTIKPMTAIESVETSFEALAVSLNDKGLVDIPYMANLCNRDNEQVIEDLKGLIFKDPLADNLNQSYDPYKNWVTADEYLSGNVVEKLEQARFFVEENEIYQQNIEALENVQPIALEAHEIDVSIGTPWIEPKYYQEFIKEVLNESSPPNIYYANSTNQWRVEEKNKDTIETTQKYGTKRMNAYSLLEHMLNQQRPKIYDVTFIDGKEKRKLNRNETIAIKQRYNVMNTDFKQWLWKDPKRRETLENKYNKIYNSEKNRQYDGSFLRFDGMNPTIKMDKHQKDGVARILFGGNTMLAHVVGAGKTYTMAAAGMEMKRLGLANKPCYLVPNHMVVQFANDYKKLYPNANVLAATKNDFLSQKRKRFCSRIATGDWDAVIMGHSSFELIPISEKRKEEKIKKDIKAVKNGITEASKDKDKKFVVKQLQRTKASLETKLKRMQDTRKDNVIEFEKLGIDALFVDEADLFKNKYIYSKMGNIAGLQTQGNNKTYDLAAKVEFINELHGSERNVVFATGTPISNSLAELFTMQTYLQKKKLEEKGLDYFDNWAANYAEVADVLEIDKTGKGYRTRQRLSKYKNLPELMNLFRQAADIQTAEMLNLPTPKLETGKPIVIDVEPSPAQKELVTALAELSNRIANGDFPDGSYNPLTVTNDGRLGALDMRCIDKAKFKELGYDIDTSDYENSKVNACIDEVYKTYKETEADRLTQLIFCDISTPKGGEKFSVYDDIKEKLIKKGVNPNEIAFIHDPKNDKEKENLFKKMRSGEMRILIGSTAKMGAGTNIQNKLIETHRIDCPYRPRDLEQADGRIMRRGNENETVRIKRYVTKGTFDSYLWQMIENKQRFISQIMTGDTPARTFEDRDTSTLNHAEIKAIASGNPLIIRKMEIENKVSELRVLENQHMADKFQLERQITKTIPEAIARAKGNVSAIEKDIVTRNRNTKNEFTMRLGRNIYDSEAKAKAGELIYKATQSNKYLGKEIGEYRGFTIIPYQANFFSDTKICLKGAQNIIVDVSASGLGTIQRLDNALNKLEEELLDYQNAISKNEKQLEAAKTQAQTPFSGEYELKVLLDELAEVDSELDLDKEDLSALIQESAENELDKILEIEETEEFEEEMEM